MAGKIIQSVVDLPNPFETVRRFEFVIERQPDETVKVHFYRETPVGTVYAYSLHFHPAQYKGFQKLFEETPASG